MIKKNISVLLVFFLIISLTGCNKNSNESSSPKTSKINQMNISNPSDKKLNNKRKTRISAVTLTPYPTSLASVVNKKYYLPITYVPKNLVYPKVPFLFKEKIEKRKMRQEAARDLEKMFAAAKKDRIYLSGVSAYRSYATQKVLFNNYVKRDGFKKAITYSAIPGASEHQTGLAIDISGADGICAVSSCFGSKKEAAWLSKNSANFGFIVRYPKGKESITGYKYEPWHLRYVGHISKPIKNRGITLEEYLGIQSVSK